MDIDILKKLEEQEQKIDKIYRSVEKMRKYLSNVSHMLLLNLYLLIKS